MDSGTQPRNPKVPRLTRRRSARGPTTTKWWVIDAAADPLSPGHRTAVHSLYVKYLKPLQCFLTGRGADSQLATDLAHQCLVDAVYKRQLPNVDQTRPFWSWLCGAGRHRLLNHRRYDSRFVGDSALETTAAPLFDLDRLLYLSKRQQIVATAYPRLQARYPKPLHALIVRDVYLDARGEPRETTDAQLSARFGKTALAVRQQRSRIKRTFERFQKEDARRLFPAARFPDPPRDWRAP